MSMNIMSSLGTGLQMYQAFSQLSAPDVDYDILNLASAQKDIEAESVMLAVEQEANNIRENFLATVGEYSYRAARRGVKVGEGTSKLNIERSSKSLGEDVQELRDNAKFRASQLKSKSKQYKSAAKAQQSIGQWERLGQVSRSASSFASSFQSKKVRSK